MREEQSERRVLDSSCLGGRLSDEEAGSQRETGACLVDQDGAPDKKKLSADSSSNFPGHDMNDDEGQDDLLGSQSVNTARFPSPVPLQEESTSSSLCVRKYSRSERKRKRIGQQRPRRSGHSKLSCASNLVANVGIGVSDDERQHSPSSVKRVSSVTKTVSRAAGDGELYSKYTDATGSGPEMEIGIQGHVDLGFQKSEVNIYSDQDLSRELNIELASMSLEDHVPLWDKAKRCVVSGKDAPTLKNLRSFLAMYPFHEILDTHGIHKGLCIHEAADANTDEAGCPSQSLEDTDLPSPVPRDSLMRARRKAAGEANRLAVEVAAVIGSLRAGDPVLESRRELETVIEGVGGLGGPLSSMRQGKLLSVAVDLLKELQELDVYGFFSSRDDVFGLPDLTLIQEQIQSGKIWSISEVCRRYRFVVACYLEYYSDGTVYFAEAERLLMEGERVIRRFRDVHALLFRHDAAVTVMKRICSNASRQATRMGVNLKMLVSQKCTLRQEKISTYEHTDDETSDFRPGTDDSDTDEIEWCTTASGDLAREAGSDTGRDQPLIRYRSNIRDEKGFSIMGKRESVKVFGLAMHRPGFDSNPYGEGHALSAQLRSNGTQSAVNSYESSCHLCGRYVEDPASNSLRCSNQASALCQRIYCLQCFFLTYRVSEKEFVHLRNSDSWICFHCRSLCPDGADCRNARPMNVLRRKRMFRMCWAAPIPVAYNRFPVAIDLYFRQSDGVYESVGQRLAGQRTLVDGSTAWMFDEIVLCGSYRCRLVLNGLWFASFTIDVPPAEDVILSNECARTCTGSVGWDAVRGSRQSGKPRVLWEAVPGSLSRGKELNCFDGPISLGAGPIRIASRTEGYDWRAAKLYPTMKWTARICGQASPRCDTSEYCFLEGIGSDSRNCCIFAVGHKIRVGTTFSVSDNCSISRKYDEMIRHSLWGLVTGRSSIHGIGLFTVNAYKKGDFVIEYAGELIRTPVADLREAKYERSGRSGFCGSTYLFKVNEEYIVDATVKSNRARFINHSCDPNMEAVVMSVRGRNLIVLVAMRWIPPYAELTFNYQLPLEEKKVTCLCRSWRCLGVIN